MKGKRTDFVILGMLSLGDSKSGYEIRKGIEQSVGSFWGESYGQIYPSLRRLNAEGLVEKRSPEAKPKKKRQEYALTERGRVCFRQWLRLPFQNDPPRNEFLLKLFFGGEADAQVSIGHIREVQRRNRLMLETLHGIENAVQKNAWQEPHRRYWMLTLNLGIVLTQAALDWCDSALAELGVIETPAREVMHPGGEPAAESPSTVTRTEEQSQTWPKE
ncbi:MAG: PadR family transcriptional regulator [Terracidiphilus sp.]|jgi:DNA-binding PadR family transcriptional regulator